MKKNKQIRVAPWPFFGRDEIQAVREVLRSGKVNYWNGEEGKNFEREFAAFTRNRYAVALSSGTVALECALRALGVGPGDEVITASRTFIASASSVVMCGARPVMAEVDPVSQNITVETIQAAITSKTKAIITVHLAGWPCDMDPIRAFAEKRGLKVIEDCAQAHGATYKGRPVGSLGHVAAFSFCQDKIMTLGGEGGMLVTQDKKIFEKSWAFKDHGKRYGAVHARKSSCGFQWLHDSFGTNWRLTEMQSAIGRIQLRKLPEWTKVRCRNAGILTQSFKHIPAFRLTIPPDDIGHSYYKYYVFVRPGELKRNWSRDRLVEEIAGAGVPCFTGSCSEIYLEKAFRKAKLGPKKRFPVAKKLGERSLVFLVHPTLTSGCMHSMCLVIEKILSQACCRF